MTAGSPGRTPLAENDDLLLGSIPERPGARPARSDHQLLLLRACCLIGAVAALASLPNARTPEETVALTVFFGVVALIPPGVRLGLPTSVAKGTAVVVVAAFLVYMTVLPETQQIEQLYWFAVLPLAGGLVLGRLGVGLGGGIALVAIVGVTIWFRDGALSLEVWGDAAIFIGSVMTMTGVYEHLSARALGRAELNLAAETQSRQALAASERDLRAILDHEPEWVKRVAEDGTVLDLNPAGLRAIGATSPGEVIGLDLRRVLAPEYHEAFSDSLSAVFRGEKRLQILETRGLDGTRRWIELHAAPLFDDRGQVKSMLGVSRDVTARVEGEAERMRHQRMEAIGALAGGIAHDLNNVLTPVRLGLDELRGHGEVTDVVDMMEEGVEHATSMVRQLLDFARGAEGARSPVDIGRVVGDVESLLSSTLPDEGVELRIALAPDLPPVLANAPQLGQILLNLCWNARDAMPRGGTIDVEARAAFVAEPQGPGGEGAEPGEFVALTVRDTGAGIPDEVLDTIFEPFFTTKSSRGGTGLGLATVLAVVRGHAGFLGVHSTVGEGTTITVHLPVASSLPPAASSSSSEPRSIERHRTVLLVDDDPAILRFVARLLRQAGFTVVTAGDGVEAEEKLGAERPDLLVTDLHMPRLDGLTLIERIRVRRPELPCVLMSGRMDETTRRRLEVLPERVVLEKPFGREELLETVERALREAPDASGNDDAS